jgi:type IV pilus assembly protein PilC
MIHFWYILLIAIAVVTIAFMQWKKTQTGKILLDTIVLKLPVFGKLVHDTIITEVTRTLGLLSGAGILVVDALKQSADVANNIVYKNAILAVAKNVEKGVSVGESMSYSSLFPPIVVEMVKVGEQTGKLDDSLTRVSAYYEQEVDARVKALTTLMEPFIIVFLGAGVGFLMLAVISPIYSLINNIPT